MDTRVGGKYYLIPILYIGLIGALLYLQFARQEPFRFRVGSLEVTGGTIAGDSSEPAVADVALKAGGLRFVFNRTHLAELTLADGTKEGLAPRSYATVPGGIEVGFASGLVVRFEMSGPTLDTLTISPSLPTSIKADSLAIPFAVAEGATVRPAGGIPALSISSKSSAAGAEETRFLTLPFGSQVRWQQRLLVFAARDDRFASAVYAPGAPGEGPVAFWFRQQGGLPDEAALARAVAAYLDKAWAGWTGNRYDAQSGTWQMRSGNPAFSEQILVDLLSQAASRGLYAKTFEALRRTIAVHSGELGLFSMPFLGNIQRSFDGNRSAFDAELASIEDSLGRGDPSVLSKPQLVTFLTDHAPAATARAALAALSANGSSASDLPSALGLLSNELEAVELGYSQSQLRSNAAGLIDQAILPAVVRTAGGLYLQGEEKSADVANGIHAGRLLVAASELMKRPVLAGIGRELIISALALSDSEGFLPGRLLLSGDSVSGTEGFLPPERIYSWIAPESYHPREVSLAQWGVPGVWLWAASRITAVEPTQGGLSLTLDFPQGLAENLVIAGMKPFTQIKLYGIPWHSDPQFEQYPAGWVYDEAAQALFVKLTHKSQAEKIEITY